MTTGERLAIGIAIILALLAIIVFSQKDKIKRVQEIKQGATVSEERQTTLSDDKKIDEIIATAKKNQADQKEAQRIIDELTEKFPINCSVLADKKNCENLIRQITGDEKIILALKKLNKSGVGVVITWYSRDNSPVYINEYGSLMIHEKASIQDIKKFFGLN